MMKREQRVRRWGFAMTEAPDQLAGDHLNGWRAEEVVILKSAGEAR